MAVETSQSMRWLYARSRPARGAICAAVAWAWMGCLLAVAQAWLLARVIHGVVVEARPPGSLAALFLGLAAAVVLRGLAGWRRETSAFAAGARVRKEVRAELLARVLARGPGVGRDDPTGALASVLMEQVEGLQDFYALFLPQLAVVVLGPVTIATAVLPVSWAAAGLLLAAAPLIPLFAVLVGMGAENISQRHFQALARLSAHFLDVLQGLETLKLFGRSRAETGRIRQVSDDYRRRTMSVLRVAFLSSAVLEFFTSLSIALVAVYLGMTFLGYFHFGTYGRPLRLAEGVFILLLAPEFFQPLRELGGFHHARAQALAAAEGIRAVLAGPLPVGRGGRLAPIAGEGFRIRCRGLALSYDCGRRPALAGVDLELRPGQRTVLVGGSGAGKSSLVSLLLGFLKPTAGEIRVNGHPLNEIDPGFWRRQVGWLGQNPVLFHGTIRTNLLMGRPGAGEEALRSAARAAGVLDFSRHLPLGLDSPVGERGLGLSRGQAQRVALGRVLLKNAPVLLLDEPTAGLDADTEAQVLHAVEAFGAGRTVLVVSHRLAEIRQADMICVMEEGRIVEQGGYDQLIQAGGRFCELAQPLAARPRHG